MARVCSCHLNPGGGCCCQNLSSVQSETTATYTPSWLRRSPTYPSGINSGTSPTAPAAGWVCPRCNRVNAPHVPFCGCSPDGVQITTSGT